MKNRITGIVLATVVMMTIAGCGKNADSVEIIADEAVAMAAEVDVAAEASAQESDSEEDKEVPFTTGTVNDNVYENEYFDMKLTVPAGYSFVGDEEIKNYSEFVAEQMKDNESFSEAIDNGAAALAATAYNEDTLDNICVLVYSDETLADAEFDAAEVMNNSMLLFKEFCESQGANITDIGFGKRNVGDEKGYVITLGGTLNGEDLNEEIVGFRKDDHLIAFAATCHSGLETDALLSLVEKN